MVELPAKPESVSHVSDAHWEAALLLAAGKHGFDNLSDCQAKIGLLPISHHARCLILLGEVDEPELPKDPLDEAIEEAWDDYDLSMEFRRFYRAIRVHVIPALEKRNG